MSLKQDILALQGDYASLEKILRTACSLLELSNTKVINSSSIQDSPIDEIVEFFVYKLYTQTKK